MQKSNLIVYLKHFSKRDWREFRKFIRSPYFNQRVDVMELFDYLDQALSNLDPMLLQRQLVFSKIYPNENFDGKKLRHLISFLLKNIKKYLAQTEFEKDHFLSQQYFCKSIRKKRLEVFFEKEINVAHTILEKEKFRDGKYFFQKYLVGIEEAAFSMPHKRSGEMNFEENAEQLTTFYISSLLRLSCNIQSHQTMSRKFYDLKFLHEILSKVESEKYLSFPSISLYFHCYKAIENFENHKIEDSEIHFFELKKLIHQHWKLLPTSEVRDIYLFAINYCIKRLNADNRKFIREAFELFRSGLENETLLEEGIISSFTYKNITRLGIALFENEWVEQFLETYKKFLLPRERENTWRYNLAFFYFEQEEYKRAMNLLIQVEFKDTLNNMDARRMLLKSYFELGEYNALESLLDSFYRYIQRQKDLGYHRENYLNLIRFVKKIIQKGGGGIEILKKLETEISATKRLAERKWLIEKVKGFRKNGFN